jgi:hypothetical protein
VADFGSECPADIVGIRTRVLRAQFRRDPAAYLSRLEQLLRQPALPA